MGHPTPARAPRPRRRASRSACEPLEPRRLFAVELLSAAAAGGATGRLPSPANDEFLEFSAPSSQLSDDGRYVVFTTYADDLVAGAPALPEGSPPRADVVVRDRLTGTTRIASLRADGLPASPCFAATISGDGRYVAFSSSDPAVVPGDANGTQDVFVRDLVANTTTLVSHTAAGVPGGGQSWYPQISRNGRYVTFFSEAGNLPGAPAGTAFGFPSLFRFDIQTGAVKPVENVNAANALGLAQQVSDDGNVVAYAATHDDGRQVYVKNMTTGAVTLASASSTGQPVGGDSELLTFELSGDGTRLAFVTDDAATPNDHNAVRDVFVRDLAAATTTLASVAADGNSFDDDSAEGSTLGLGGRAISNDGRFVVVETLDPLTGVPDRGTGENNFADVFVRDLQANTTRLVSVDPPGDEPEDAYFGSISADGRFVAFMRDHPFMGANPTQLVVVDLSTGREAVANAAPGGGVYDLGEGVAGGGHFNRSGTVVVFQGYPPASALLPGINDTNDGSDVFAFDLSGLDAQAPTAAAAALAPVTTAGATLYDFTVTYTDNVAMDPASLGNGNVVVTGPNAYRQPATLLGATPAAGGATMNATYRVIAPNGVFDAIANGAYAVEVVAGQVKDAAGNAVAGGAVAGATFSVNIPLVDGPDLQATALQGSVPASVVAGAKQKVRPLLLTVTNAGTQPATGSVTLRLLASADAVADAGDAVVAETPNQKVKLAPGKSKVFKVKPRAFPAIADGDYRLIALIDAAGVLPERLESNNAAALGTTVRVAAPFSDVGLSSPVLVGKLAPGRKATVVVTARNDGNQVAKGAQSVRVRLTTDPANPDAPSRTIDLPLKLNLKPGVTRALRGKLLLPADLPPGTYSVVVELLAGAPWSDPNAANNTATGASAYTV